MLVNKILFNCQSWSRLKETELKDLEKVQLQTLKQIMRVPYSTSNTGTYLELGILPLRACSHEPGTVNYPGVMVAPGQVLPRVHVMTCCPGATLPRVNFIAPGQVHRHLITTNLSEFL